MKGLVKEYVCIHAIAKAQMGLERIVLSEISQAVRDKYHMISPLNRT